jgi:hypothetical protein
VLIWGDGLPAEEIAGYAGTLAYELFCGLNNRVRFNYVGWNAALALNKSGCAIGFDLGWVISMEWRAWPVGFRPWALLDEHDHVDFALRCKPL